MSQSPQSLERFLDFLEWSHVQEIMSGHAASRAGQNRLSELRPVFDQAEVRRRLGLTQQARDLLEEATPPDLSEISDVGSVFARLQRRTVLPAGLLRGLARTILAGEAAREAFQGRPALAALVTHQESLPPQEVERRADERRVLAEELLEVIGDYGVLIDAASPRLESLREQLQATVVQLMEELRAYAQTAEVYPALVDHDPVLYDEHPCLRVNPQDLRRVPGYIRGEGQRELLVEPDICNQSYNELRNLELEERAEVERILSGFTTRACAHRELLEALGEGLITADLHLALARYARELGMTRPNLDDGLDLELLQARHPLLSRQEGGAVPIDLVMTADQRLVVISGPNGGGKTVAMKTAGLLAALAQAGSFVPAAAGTKLPVFERLLVVADAPSSVASGLSTFQTHARDLTAVVGQAGPRSLFLLDEIGSGTDPAEASALAQAYLEHLLTLEARTLATTHLAGLKRFALQAEGACSAAVGQDDTGRPTFRLAQGEVGRSFALEVAREAGLPAGICARAEVLHRGASQEIA
jgi:DNA mismatch repair protein MutS2